jgi:hypothetical protein
LGEIQDPNYYNREELKIGKTHRHKIIHHCETASQNVVTERTQAKAIFLIWSYSSLVKQLFNIFDPCIIHI